MYHIVGVPLNVTVAFPPEMRGTALIWMDPPDHTRVRQALNKIISPSTIKRWREDFERVADRLMDEILERGSVDAVADVSEAFVSEVFPDALGLPNSPERRRESPERRGMP